uniref:Uncharacterized protein n=1 Tax=Coccidioides posadasii RMSCC 3488 TaxID=454284 RepID=A0A0J6FVQ7_COCPO|nr:hypothetical protein CPAG_09538 [Coccidioides posadasii RMSCC 3488]
MGMTDPRSFHGRVRSTLKGTGFQSLPARCERLLKAEVRTWAETCTLQIAPPNKDTELGWTSKQQGNGEETIDESQKAAAPRNTTPPEAAWGLAESADSPSADARLFLASAHG